MMRQTKQKPYNSGTMTESAFFGWIRSGLRRMSIRWRPRTEFLQSIRRPKENGGRSKWEYPCNMCGEWFIQARIEVNHIVPCGSLKSFDDIGEFCKRLFIEKNGYECLCKPCHLSVTKNQNNR